MLWHAPWGGRAAIEGASVLDAFAGTGALGLEALSRGAAEAVFIEQNPAALTALSANLAALGARGTVLGADVLAAPPGTRRDLVLLDPPYGRDLLGAAVARLAATGWLGPGTLLVAEMGREETPPPLVGSPLAGALLADRAHGAARIVVWRVGTA